MVKLSTKVSRIVSPYQYFWNFYLKDAPQFMLTATRENLDSQVLSKWVNKIERPRVNYELLDRKLESQTGRRYANFYLSVDGEVFSSWNNAEIQKNNSPSPWVLKRLPINDEKFKSIWSGREHGVALTGNNKVYTWGSNNLGQLGFDLYDFKEQIKLEMNNESEEVLSYRYKPEAIPYFNNHLHKFQVNKISWGDDFTIAVTKNGKLYGWGDNTYHQLALDNSTSSLVYHTESWDNSFVLEPVEIKWIQNTKQGFEKITEEAQIDSVIWGSKYTYAISTESKIFFWGLSKYGLNLKPNSTIEKTPLHLDTLDAKEFKTLSTYENHVLALGNCIELTFTHPSMPESRFTFLGIPNDYSVMDINFFKITEEEVFIINDYDLPYAVLKHRKKKGRMTRRNKQKLLLKLIKRDLDSYNPEDDKLSDDEEEESEEE